VLITQNSAFKSLAFYFSFCYVFQVEVEIFFLESKYGYAIGEKVKVWDEDEEDWFSAIIGKTQGQQYFVQYVGYDSSYDEWVDLDEIC
jgi:hypothetical protein